MSFSILITGCSGFVGENIVNYFLRHTENTTVIGVDRHHPKVENKRFLFRQMDLCNDSFDKLDKVDFVLHLAGQPSVWFAEKDFVLDFDLNLKPIISVLEFVIRRHLPLIFLSTIAVYDDSYYPRAEQDLDEQTTWYGLSKLTCERYCLFAGKKFGFPSVVLRSGYLYDHNVARGPVADAMSGPDLYKYNSPLSEFDFIHVEDLFFAILSILQTPENITSGVFNVGSDIGIKIQDLGDRLGFALPKPVLPSRRLIMNSQQFRRSYNWAPKHDFWLDIDTILSIKN